MHFIWLVQAAICTSLTSKLEKAASIHVPPTRYASHVKIAASGFTISWEEVKLKATLIDTPPANEVMFKHLLSTGDKVISVLSGQGTSKIPGSDYVSLYEMVNYSMVHHHAYFNWDAERIRPWSGLHGFLRDIKLNLEQTQSQVQSFRGLQQKMATERLELAKQEGQPMAVALISSAEQEVTALGVALADHASVEKGGIFIIGEVIADQQGKKGNVFYLDPLKEDVMWVAEMSEVEHLSESETALCCTAKHLSESETDFCCTAEHLSESETALWCALDLHLSESGKRTLVSMILAIGVKLLMELPIPQVKQHQEFFATLMQRVKQGHWDQLGSLVNGYREDLTIRLSLV